MATQKYKYRPYRTRKQEQSRRVRNITLTLIVIIVGGIILTKMYNKKDTEPSQTEGMDTRSLSDVQEGSSEGASTSDNQGAQSGPTTAEETVEAQTPETTEEAVVVEEQVPDASEEDIETSQEARELVEQAIELRKQGQIIAARRMMNHALDLQLSPQLRSSIKKELSILAKTWLFSKEVLADDELTGTYRVAPGDRLAVIAKRYKVPYEVLMEINGIHRPELLQAGQTIKVINGPFNAVVYKKNLTMDLYLQDKYVKTYRVGLGAVGHDTPSGLWRVKAGGKFNNKPSWPNPETGKLVYGDDPEYPLGERYIAIEGLDENTKDRSGFAIHGTNDPDSIGKSESAGCVRMYNDDVIELYQMLRDGVSEVWVKD